MGERLVILSHVLGAMAVNAGDGDGDDAHRSLGVRRTAARTAASRPLSPSFPGRAARARYKSGRRRRRGAHSAR